MTHKRYAIYWAPPADSALSRYGAGWLGRDAENGNPVTPLLSESDQALVAEPRRYGLHATLKPPFALAAGKSVETLEQALSGFAAARPGVALGRLQVTNLKGFLALCTPDRVSALHALADACVREFDMFRAPPSEGELAKRRKAGLSPAQEAHLTRWGYPYVFDQFTLHVTFTQRLDDATRARLQARLEADLKEILAEDFTVADLALFEEPGPGAPFMLRRRFKMRPTED